MKVAAAIETAKITKSTPIKTGENMNLMTFIKR
jgi:hypothetical protein